MGGVDGGPGVPVVNWSTQAEDLRAPHFVGIHALQVLPLVAWLRGRRGRRLGLGGGRQVGLVHLAGAVYLGVVVLLLWQALRGESVTRPGAATLTAAGLTAAGLLGLAGMAAAVFLAAFRPSTHPNQQIR